jgi:hypothetical protein
MGWLFGIFFLNCLLCNCISIYGIRRETSDLDTRDYGMVHDAGGLLWSGMLGFSRLQLI